MKELKEAIKTLWSYITNIPQSPLRNMLVDCLDLGTMANQIKSFSFYWSKLIKETWIRPKRNMRMRTMQSSVKPSMKPPRLPHQLDQDIFVQSKGRFRSACLDHRCICKMDQAASSRNIYSVRKKRRRKASRRGKKQAQRIAQTEQRPSCTLSN